ncbi:hypothetical protein A374_16353 [Fictibacillus macauensis ZFHKF-1]|uniref:Uncharacterized protein n=1 Tax=Fictibacillus macauensis ZFHKF-1 TaxID=1196324 RepID=I8UBQ2_9BACL|nr:hypothetical protein [Fictibacillus macauensis]EIT84375.1 hypothetical protein A374_16353 [Fictibacillus macauensis ZFHKF-1]
MSRYRAYGMIGYLFLYTSFTFYVDAKNGNGISSLIMLAIAVLCFFLQYRLTVPHRAAQNYARQGALLLLTIVPALWLSGHDPFFAKLFMAVTTLTLIYYNSQQEALFTKEAMIRSTVWYELAQAGIFEGTLTITPTLLQDAIASDPDFFHFCSEQLKDEPNISYVLDSFWFHEQKIHLNVSYDSIEKQIMVPLLAHLRAIYEEESRYAL